MKLIFAGTPEFAQVSLSRLHQAGFEIALVLTQPDRPAGRGMKVSPSAVKAFALRHGLPAIQPRSLRTDGPYSAEAGVAQAALGDAHADIMVVAAYGLILPPWALDLAPLGCLNVHASLLPRWRGAAPIQRAIEAGDTRTGITVMQMDTGLDTGDMLLTDSIDIAADDTSASLHQRLADLGGGMIVDALERVAQGGLRPTPQPVAGVTYAHKIDKREAMIDWRHPAPVIERRLRAFDPVPGAGSPLGGEVVKLWRAQVVAGSGVPGEVLAVSDLGIVVACGDAALQLTELQRPGGKRVSARHFLQSRAVSPGMRWASPD